MGLWIIMLITGIAFTFFSLKTIGNAKSAFQVLALVMWIGLATLHGAGFEVSASTTNLTYNETNDLIFNETKSEVVIPGGESAYWISYLFISFAVFNFVILFRDITRV
jgi:hypothetical protein